MQRPETMQDHDLEASNQASQQFELALIHAARLAGAPVGQRSIDWQHCYETVSIEQDLIGLPRFTAEVRPEEQLSLVTEMSKPIGWITMPADARAEHLRLRFELWPEGRVAMMLDENHTRRFMSEGWREIDATHSIGPLMMGAFINDMASIEALAPATFAENARNAA